VNVDQNYAVQAALRGKGMDRNTASRERRGRIQCKTKAAANYFGKWYTPRCIRYGSVFIGTQI
jgi:hypothetical protein